MLKGLGCLQGKESSEQHIRELCGGLISGESCPGPMGCLSVLGSAEPWEGVAGPVWGRCWKRLQGSSAVQDEAPRSHLVSKNKSHS